MGARSGTMARRGSDPGDTMRMPVPRELRRDGDRGRRDNLAALVLALAIALAFAAILCWKCDTAFDGDWQAMLDAPLHPGHTYIPNWGYVPDEPPRTRITD